MTLPHAGYLPAMPSVSVVLDTGIFYSASKACSPLLAIVCKHNACR